MTTERKAILTIEGKPPVEFPILTPSIGNDCIDIRSLAAKTGMFTYDSGFLSTAACQSKITFIDGDKGELLYRGYPIEQLAEQNAQVIRTVDLLRTGAQRLAWACGVLGLCMIGLGIYLFSR